MAKYKYSCSCCFSSVDFNFAIKEYIELKKTNYFKKIKCNNCNNICEFNQVFGSLSSKIPKDKETVLREIKEEVRKITDKVKSGDSKAIRTVYGED